MKEFHQHLANAAGSSHRWRATAERLMLVLDLLEPEIELEWALLRSAHRAGGRGRKGPSPDSTSVREVYLMLAAYAAENLLKARLVSRSPGMYRDEISREGKLPGELTTHDLLRMARMVGMPLDEGEEDLLLRLTAHAEWRGRYPAPVRAKDLAGAAHPDGGARQYVRLTAGDDVKRVRQLLSRLHAERWPPVAGL